MKRLVPRKCTRKVYLGDVTVRLPDGSAFDASTVSLSRSGLAFFSGRFVGVGQAVELSLRGPGASKGASECRFHARVVRARSERDGNIIGVSFARDLTPGEMRTLQVNLAD